MINAIIRWSISQRLLVLLATLVLIAGGLYSVKQTPVDAIPDLSDVQVIIKTSYPGQAPQVVEDQVTYPLTSAMALGSRCGDGARLFLLWRLLCLCDF